MTQENKWPSDWGEEVAKQKKLLEDFVRKMNKAQPPKTEHMGITHFIDHNNLTIKPMPHEYLYWSPFSDAIDRYVVSQIEQTAEANRRMEEMLEPVKAFDTVAEADEFIADVERYLGYG